MFQVFQNLSNGETILLDVPRPEPRLGHALIETSNTLVSAGTERMLLDFGKAGWIKKARSQPDKVRMVLDKVKTDGLLSTIDAVNSKLSKPLPLGYCNVGIVRDPTDTGFEVGARVISNGHHADYVCVPKNLIAKVPDNVDDETAAFTVLASIALQGVRLADPKLGETVVVIGLGLIGLLTVQILKANGCRVLGVDYDPARCELAKKYGAKVVDLSTGVDPVAEASAFSGRNGVDAVIITANSDSNLIVHQAATMCRKRGSIILVGVVGLELNRADFYEKELKFQVSCSYGPGRYDQRYEVDGLDYPLPFVRWTEKRNFEAVLNLMADGSINTVDLVDYVFDIFDAQLAYEKLSNPSVLGILLRYSQTMQPLKEARSIELELAHPYQVSSNNISFIGAGNYASRVLIPMFQKSGTNLTTLVSEGGYNSVFFGKKFGFKNASTEFDAIFDDGSASIVIATRHNLHASQIIAALKAEKNVFVEKPLALLHSEVDQIEEELNKTNKLLMVGYNRRFAPQIKKIKEILGTTAAPKCFNFTINAGSIPEEHWTQDRKIGGGRIIGEACHFIDLMRFLAGFRISEISGIKMGSNAYHNVTDDNAIIKIGFEDGSIGSISYFSNGNNSFPKERLEVFCNGAVLQLDNFKTLKGYGWDNFKNYRLLRQNKGQKECVSSFIDAILNSKQSPIKHEEIFEVARATIDVAEMLR